MAHERWKESQEYSGRDRHHAGSIGRSRDVGVEFRSGGVRPFVLSCQVFVDVKITLRLSIASHTDHI